MGALYFAPDNLAGKVVFPKAIYGNHYDYPTDYERFNGSKFSLKLTVFISSDNIGKEVILFGHISESFGVPRYFTRFFIDAAGMPNLEGFFTTTQRINVSTDTPIPYDEVFEITLNYDNSSLLGIYINGVKQGFVKRSTSSSYTWIGQGGNFYIGDHKDLPQPQGVMFFNVQLTDSISIPSGISTSKYTTKWEMDFEDELNPLQIKGSRGGASGVVTNPATIPYQPEKLIWTDQQTPPDIDTGGGGGGGGGIVIPGNGNTTQVTGIITENDVPVSRRVFAVTEAELAIDGSSETTQAVLDSQVSDPNDGSYTLDTSPYEAAVLVVAQDNLGEVWQASAAVQVGDVVRPVNFSGYVYICTLAGTTGSSEPVWAIDTSLSQQDGTAQWQAKPFSRPLAHAPIIPTIVPTE